MKRLTSADDDAAAEMIRTRGGGQTPFDVGRSLLTELLVLVVCGIFWLQTNKFEQDDPEGLGPTFVPRLLIILLVVCVLARVAQKLVERSRGTSTQRLQPSDQAPPDQETTIDEEEHPSSSRYLMVAIVLAVGYVFGTTYLGYPLATFLLVIAFVWTTSRLTWAMLAIALGTGLGFPYLFVKVVFLDLPSGVGVFDDFTVWLYNLLGIY